MADRQEQLKGKWADLACKHSEVGLLNDAQLLQQVGERPPVHELHDHNDAAALKVRLRQHECIVPFAALLSNCLYKCLQFHGCCETVVLDAIKVV